LEEEKSSEYQDIFAAHVYKLLNLGVDNKGIAQFLEVSEDLLNEWRNTIPDIFEAFKQGEKNQNDQVTASLFKRAVGFSYMEKSTEVSNGMFKEKTTLKTVLPETNAAKFWLLNREPEKWKENTENLSIKELKISVKRKKMD